MIGERVMSTEDGALGTVTAVIDGELDFYMIRDDDGTEWFGFAYEDFFVTEED